MEKVEVTIKKHDLCTPPLSKGTKTKEFRKKNRIWLPRLKSYFSGSKFDKISPKTKNNDRISQPIQHMFIE